MTKTHKCDACGGSGMLCPGRWYPRCDVCLGSGRISDVMPASDAIADAETLRLNARDDGYGPAVYRGVRAAGENGEWCAHYAKTRAHDGAPERAVYAARAAFRAVPGLRA